MTHYDIDEYMEDEAEIRTFVQREAHDASGQYRPAPPEWVTSQNQCPYCESEFDGVAVETTRAYRLDTDLNRIDTICPTCRNEARMHELNTLDFSLYDATTRPTHIIRWEYFPSEWTQMHSDPHGFYSDQWVDAEGRDLDTLGLEYIFGVHQAEASGWRRLPIPGMSVTARIADEI